MGKLYKALNNIELARKNSIRNAKAAGLPATDDMTLNGLSDLYRLQNNKETVEVDNIEYEEWSEPEDWIDIKTILENEPNLMYKDKSYTPILAILLTDESDVNNDIVNNSFINYPYILKTSDGQVLENTTISSSKPIVWDKSKDVHCSLGYNMRYILYYYNTEQLETLISSNSSLSSNFVFYNKPTLKVVYGNAPFSNIGSFYVQSGNITNNYIKVLDCLDNTKIFSIPTNYYSGSTNEVRSLKEISIKLSYDYKYNGSYSLCGSNSCDIEKISYYGVTALTGTSSSYHLFNNCQNLRELNLPDLEETAYLLSGCNKIKSLSLSKLKKSKGMLISSMYVLENLNLPLLEESGVICSYCNRIESIVLPKLKKVTSEYGNLISNCSALTELSLPSLEEVTPSSTSYTSGSGLIYSCNALKYIQFPSLKEVNIKCPLLANNDSVLDLPIVENISAYSLSAIESKNLKINAPVLKNIYVKDISSSFTSYYTDIYVNHDDKINITVESNQQSLDWKSTAYCKLHDDKIGHIIFGRELTLPTLQKYLMHSKFDKVTCKLKNGPTYSVSDKPIYLNNDNVLCRDGVELDLLDGSDISAHTLINHNNLVKILNNLSVLSDGESRTFTLGTTLLSMLSDEEKAVATNKGWVLA